ncbi:NADH dehydrogenase [ubiquinone] 1 alpha subcomplex subunit 5 [Pezoporus wallicus]|uniref:NADH dehydrogenase [ubiquinone] 1 alpha subcomplex subunit 5 n=1 Tax=Pezoporus wallicus TaxID=35540 RepID=UPI00254F68EA|nr:NADH dehydrogenase [ubiquinone] 1 alpha subcomplex subunit 5 [Pezoporus wallicus]
MAGCSKAQAAAYSYSRPCPPRSAELQTPTCRRVGQPPRTKAAHDPGLSQIQEQDPKAGLASHTEPGLPPSQPGLTETPPPLPAAPERRPSHLPPNRGNGCLGILNVFMLCVQTTGLVGLAVTENPHERLRMLYTKILGVLQNIPKDAAYRKYTEQIINERFNLVQTETDVQKLQDKLNSGHIEEVILQAESELSLARKMMQWKPWEPLVEEPPSDQWRWPI